MAEFFVHGKEMALWLPVTVAHGERPGLLEFLMRLETYLTSAVWAVEPTELQLVWARGSFVCPRSSSGGTPCPGCKVQKGR